MRVRLVKYTYQSLRFNSTKYHLEFKTLFGWKALFVPDGDRFVLASATEQDKNDLVEKAREILIGNKASYEIRIDSEVEIIRRDFR